MKTPPSASASPETPSAVFAAQRAEAQRARELAQKRDRAAKGRRDLAEFEPQVPHLAWADDEDLTARALRAYADGIEATTCAGDCDTGYGLCELCVSASEEAPR